MPCAMHWRRRNTPIRPRPVSLNSMSHDIRTPMNAIIGFTALATAHIDNIDLVKEYLKKISVSGQHLLSLINDILDMSRIESGTVKLDNTEVHLPDVPARPTHNHSRQYQRQTA